MKKNYSARFKIKRSDLMFANLVTVIRRDSRRLTDWRSESKDTVRFSLQEAFVS